MITLQRSTLAQRNSPGFFFFSFREVRPHEIKKEISKSQSWCFYHQRKQIFHKGLQDGCQNTSACVGTWPRSSVWKCLACASCLGSHCSMYFTESPADWFLFCTELLAVKWRYLGIWKLLRCLLPLRGFRGQGSLFLVKDTSLDVSAGIHVPECPAVWPKGKKENACLWSCSTTPHFPQNQHEVVRTFSQTWVNVRHYGNAEPTVLNSEARQPTHLSPLFVFWLWHPSEIQWAVILQFWVGGNLQILHWKAICVGARQSLSDNLSRFSPRLMCGVCFWKHLRDFPSFKKNVYKIMLTPHGFNWGLQPSFKPTSILILCHGQDCVKTENETAGDQRCTGIKVNKSLGIPAFRQHW